MHSIDNNNLSDKLSNAAAILDDMEKSDMHSLDGKIFRDMISNAAAILDDRKKIINDLNVFPVPDGDTGTNMSLTAGAAAEALSSGAEMSLSKVADTVAAAMLRGARGNSGVILSLLFRGFARSLKGIDRATPSAFALALSEGVKAAYQAVMKPTEGTILTVSRLAAAAACDTCTNHAAISFEEMLAYTIEAAKAALANTINQNPVLKKAGVIDSGGKGYVYLLEAFELGIKGERIEVSKHGGEADKATFSNFDEGDITFSYCTEFIVTRDTSNPKSPHLLRGFLDAIGDSIVVVDDDEIIKVHVHTDTPGDVLTEALTYGTLFTVKIENMRNQHTSIVAEEAAPSVEEPEIAEPTEDYGFVAVCAGDGLAKIFRDLGVNRIVSGGQTMNPSTEDIIREINKTPAKTVFVLPNNSNIILAAQQAAPQISGKKVIVIPSKSVPQGVSALLAFNPDGNAEANAKDMTATLENVTTISVTKAARDSVFDDTSIFEGDWLALIESKLLFATPDFRLLLNRVNEELIRKDPEFVTVYLGSGADKDALNLTVTDSTELTIVTGGQPVYDYIISLE
ncbi:MAG: DAK2 domain-containing protein [Oscillospiraceae bacterium]|nr:DAK2 domain-containing protein [Oscillospiraceae bacterium]